MVVLLLLLLAVLQLLGFLFLPSMPFSWLVLFVAADIVVSTFFAAASAMHKRPESRVNLTVAPSLSLSLSLTHTICPTE